MRFKLSALWPIFTVALLFSMSCYSANQTEEAEVKQPLRVLTWEGYVTAEDVREVNLILTEQGYNYEVELVTPFAQSADQMFDLIRARKCDITFLTLYFIKMQKEQTSKLLQAINIQSPRLTHFPDLHAKLTRLDIGINANGEPLYIPWGGGIYGFYINTDKVKQADIPTSVSDLWLDEWKNTFSLNIAQEWYNLGLALMSMGHSPFYLYESLKSHDRQTVLKMSSPDGELQYKIAKLYLAAKSFWLNSSGFNDELLIVSSWGPEVHSQHVKGDNWQLIDFKEGHMAWLDTINFVKGVEGKKLEAAEIFANYFIGKEVQTRISSELSMIPASKKVAANPMLGDVNNIVKKIWVVPPFDNSSYDIMKKMTDRAKVTTGH
ncbi:extracellular solute-binding protein [Shewanella canadensis]|uniref:Extracellular solute-binding protein n=1 Tax=Shewanella canadensis TaxID=271096 RepID=A0A431WT83_9GAMM|nr:extracellular solute-binding protein [Shewanella canadensis]RTR38751.1 extracellular solute-binding protein [Shewanella canadensis]